MDVNEVEVQRNKYPLALKAGTILARGEEKLLCKYEILKVLGQGGFGITYLAKDCLNGETVAIKEYFPTEFATRRMDGVTISPISEEKNGYFSYGRGQFLEEAKTLSRFSGTPGIVRIQRYFEINGTAYFVMEYVQGKSLEDLVKARGPLSPEQAEPVFEKLMTALATVHAQGIVHRDIAPDNIIITGRGEPKLIDFGAARYSTGEKSCSLDVILKHGFAPLEQYTRHGRQGSFTDVYALAATYYYALTGRVPPDSVDRLTNDTLILPTALGVKLSREAEEALMTALNVQYQDRYADMNAFRAGMRGAGGNAGAGGTVHTGGMHAERIPVSVPQTGSNTVPLLDRAYIFIDNGEWSRADEYCEKVLDTDPRNARAHLGKLLAEFRVHTPEELKNLKIPVSASVNYCNVTRFADADLSAKIKTYAAEADANAAKEESVKPPKPKPKWSLALFLLLGLLLCAGVFAALKFLKPGDKTEIPPPTAEITRAPTPASTPGAVEAPKTAELLGLRSEDVAVGEYVTFGTYEQDNDAENGDEPIEWLILDRQDGRVLLLSRYGLDCKQYNTQNEAVTWEKCSLRTWLNTGFLGRAFSVTEQRRIEKAEVSADKNPKYDTEPGNATKDEVFLLSIAETEKYFMDDASRMCVPTEYAKAQGVWTKEENEVNGKAACVWWLRSPGSAQSSASGVYYGGGIYSLGDYVNFSADCVRPALWVNLAS